MSRASLAVMACALVASAAVPAVAGAAKPPQAKPTPAKASAKLQQAVTAAGIERHQRELAAIAQRNGGTRASGTVGFDRSRDYVAQRLRAAGYAVTIQSFTFPFFEETGDPTLERTGAGAKVYTEGPAADFTTMEYSGSGDVSGTIVPVDLVLPPTPEPSSTSGCEAADFAGFPAGAIALVQRGTCTFGEKLDNAAAAGAAAIVIFNEGQEGRTDASAGTLGAPKSIPAVFTSFAVGQELATAAEGGDVPVHVVTSTVSETRETSNVIADTVNGDPARTVVVGSHLDSVVDGPGINDNGSGSAQDLEIAEELAKVVKKPVNRVRFAFWGAEESGLLGSTYYVASLTQAQRDEIMGNLNFDMTASPNFARFVYDGDGSATPDSGPVGSDLIEALFVDHFTAKGLASEPTAFDGRSDYGPFIDVGIPAGGLFSGAEEIKTAEQVALYGGTAGVAFDPCYHQACDTLANLNGQAADEFADASAHAVGMLTQRTVSLSDNETPQAKRLAAPAPEFRGPHAIR